MRRALLMATLLGCSGQSLAALAAGGKIRQMFQYLDNPALSAGDLPLWQQRWLGRLDWQPTRHHQLVGELILAWDSADLMTDAGLTSHSDFLELGLDYRF